jgi:RNA polymerase sigma factor (sigma-70 family)
VSERKNLDHLGNQSFGSSISASSHRDVLLDRYLAEVGCHPTLDAESEGLLAERYARGDQDAGNRLITANLRLVVKMATQYRWRWVRLLDLIQEGNVGLTIALSRYDASRGVPFGRYAAYWIRAMILRYLSANYRLVDMGSGQHARKLFFRLNRERARLLSDGIDPTPRALADAFGIPEARSATSTSSCGLQRSPFTRPAARTAHRWRFSSATVVPPTPSTSLQSWSGAPWSAASLIALASASTTSASA